MGWIAADCAGVVAGKTYEASAYLHAEGVASVQDSVTAFVTPRRSTPKTPARVAVLAAQREEGGWWRLAVRAQAPEDVASAQLFLGLRWAPHGRVWWDDVSLQEVPAAPARTVRLATSYLNGVTRGPETWRELLETAGGGGADIACLGELATIVPQDPEARPTIPGQPPMSSLSTRASIT